MKPQIPQDFIDEEAVPVCPDCHTPLEEDWIGNELAWLVRKEYRARHPKTLEELNTHAAKADKAA